MAKKAAKKKATKKKEAKKKAQPKSVRAFDVMSSEGMDALDRSRELMAQVTMRRKNRPADFKTMAEVRYDTALVNDIYFQYLLGRVGIPKPGLVELVGRTGIGKSTMAAFLVGQLLRYERAPALWFEGEGKPLSRSRVRRCLSNDPAEAERLMRAVTFKRVSTLKEFEEVFFTCVGVLRGFVSIGNKSVIIPKSTPITVVLDPFSKLLSDAEASGVVPFEKLQDADMKATGAGAGNPRHAKWASQFSRRLSFLMEEYNLIFIMTHHQTDKVMEAQAGGTAAKRGPQPSESTIALRNVNKLGGRGFDQSASLILTMTDGPTVKDSSNKPRGQEIYCQAYKHSYGPGQRRISWELRQEHGAFDIPGQYLDSALHFERFGVRWLATNKYLGIRVDANLYTCPALGLAAVDEDVLYRALHANHDVLNRLGLQLDIEGYNPAVDQIVEQLRTNPPEPSTDIPFSPPNWTHGEQTNTEFDDDETEDID